MLYGEEGGPFAVVKRYHSYIHNEQKSLLLLLMTRWSRFKKTRQDMFVPLTKSSTITVSVEVKSARWPDLLSIVVRLRVYGPS